MADRDPPPEAAAFRGPAWLPGGHAQTIYPYFLRRPDVVYRRERVATPDGDFWDFDWRVDDRPPVPGAPLVVLFHGLEGGAQSHYARLTMDELARRGWRGVVPHFRGCGGEPNRLPRAYHSGDHEEIAAMLAAVRARVDASTPAVRDRRVARRQCAAQLARSCRTARRAHAGGARPPRRCRST